MATVKTDTKTSKLSTIEAQFTRAWIACKNPDLDGKNPHFRNGYATLKETLRVIRGACKSEGLAYRQQFSFLPDNIAIATLSSYVVNEEGSKLHLSDFPVQYVANAQHFGAYLTYTKRQQAQTGWGITGEPDDDAEQVTNQPAKQPAPQKPVPVQSKREKLLDRIAELQGQLANPELLDEMVYSMFGTGLADLNEEQLLETGKQLSLMVKGQGNEH